MAEAADGATALALIAQSAPAVILLDARLPDGSGFDTCAAIRRIPNGRSVPILMMTGMDASALRPQALEVGATDIIGKPVQMLVLAQRLKSLVERVQETDPTVGS